MSHPSAGALAGNDWVVVRELNINYHYSETILLTIYVYMHIMVTLIKSLSSNPDELLAPPGILGKLRRAQTRSPFLLLTVGNIPNSTLIQDLELL